MHTLKSLTLTAVPKQQLNNPVLTRRAKLIARLKEQKALLADPTFVAVHQVWETTPEDRKERIERKRKVRRWWREDATGAVYLVLRYGQKPIEIEKGKAAIVVPSKNELDGVLDVLVTAVNAGELDEAIAAMPRTTPLKKKPDA